MDYLDPHIILEEIYLIEKSLLEFCSELHVIYAVIEKGQIVVFRVISVLAAYSFSLRKCVPIMKHPIEARLVCF